MQRWSTTTLSLSCSYIQHCAKDAFAAVFAQEATGGAQGPPHHYFPLPATSPGISHREGICQAVTEDHRQMIA